jgi:uronate dehydrogenase
MIPERTSASSLKDPLFITGADGMVGKVLRERLGTTHSVTGADWHAQRGDRGIRRLDVTRMEALRRALRGHDVIIDLASYTALNVEPTWQDIYSNNLKAVHSVFEAARHANVRRVIYASTNRVTGMYERDEPYASILRGDRAGLDPEAIQGIDSHSAIRPSGLYAVGKAFGEAMGRFYAEEYGLSVICIRIGSVLEQDRPRLPRHLSTFLSHRDLAQLVRACIEAPEDVGYAIYYGVSANTWRIWDIDDARQIGYEPQDDAEAWRGGLGLDMESTE